MASPNTNGVSAFEDVPRPSDVPIYAVMAAFSKDPSPVKLNLGVGVYRAEDGKPHVLNVVRRAERLIIEDMSSTKEYLPITGLAEFNKLSAQLVFGVDSVAIKENRVTTVQSVSGCMSLRIGAEFLAQHYPQCIVYLPGPTYGNHPNFFLAVGHTLKTYRYYDPITHGLDFQGMLEDLGSAQSGAIVLLQACGHNPTGVDPTVEQWEQIRQLIRLKGLLPFFDCAYQGFVSGNLDMDAQSIRIFVGDGGECLVAQSYSKIMGIYAERVGALSIVCKTADVASRVNSQLKLVIRPMYSNPTIHGAAIVATILKDREMVTEWTAELKAIVDRITNLRQQLYDALCNKGDQILKPFEPIKFPKGTSSEMLEHLEQSISKKTRTGTPGDWSHITRQVGMYTFSGLNEQQVAFLMKEYHVYMSSDGRINVAGLSKKTVPYLADAMHAAITRVR